MSTNATNNVPTRIRPIGVYTPVDTLMRPGSSSAPTVPAPPAPRVPAPPVATLPQAPNVPAAPPLPPASTKPQVPAQPGAQPTGGGFFRSFFADLWLGMKDQGKKNAYMAMHPIQSVKNSIHSTPAKAVSPYAEAVRAGHSGYAVGRVLTNVVTLAGLFFGGRFLLGRLGGLGLGGGAGVGSGGGVLGGIGRVVGGAVRGVGNFFGSIFSGTGSVLGSIGRGVGSVFGGLFRGIGNVASSVFHGIGSFFRWIIPGGGASVGFR